MKILVLDAALTIGYCCAEKIKGDTNIIAYGTIYTELDEVKECRKKLKELGMKAPKKHRTTFEELLQRLNIIRLNILSLLVFQKPELVIIEKLNLDFQRGMNWHSLMLYSSAFTCVYETLKQSGVAIEFVSASKGKLTKKQARYICETQYGLKGVSGHCAETIAWAFPRHDCREIQEIISATKIMIDAILEKQEK